MRVLLTGASGFLGLNIVQALLFTGHEVRCYSRPAARMKYLSQLKVQHVTGELQDEHALALALDGIEAVIHTAGDTSTDLRDRGRLWATNVEGTRAVVERALGAGVRRLVFTSTTSTIGGSSNSKGASEQEPLAGFRARSPYAETKLIAEDLVRKACQRGLHAIILNPAEVIGAFDHTLQWGRIIVAASLGKVPFLPSGGASFCTAKAVAAAHVAALERGVSGQRYLLGGSNLSFAEFFRIVAETTGRAIKPTFEPYAAAYYQALLAEQGLTQTPGADSYRMRVFKSHVYFDSSLAQRELGYAPGDVREATREAYDWYCAQGIIATTHGVRESRQASLEG